MPHIVHSHSQPTPSSVSEISGRPWLPGPLSLPRMYRLSADSHSVRLLIDSPDNPHHAAPRACGRPRRTHTPLYSLSLLDQTLGGRHPRPRGRVFLAGCASEPLFSPEKPADTWMSMPTSHTLTGHLPELFQTPSGEKDFQWQQEYGSVVRVKAPLGVRLVFSSRDCPVRSLYNCCAMAVCYIRRTCS